ncbi:hypothetical protein OAQ84_00155 [Bdellovibrionales bacterium]|nr:hypothetical protein [Bdellovibrionales bacterium]
MILQLIHLALMPKIPLVYALFSSLKNDELQLLREASSKLLDIPTPFIYLAQATIYVFIPLSITIFSYLKKYKVALALYCVGFFYSSALLARSPALLFTLNVIILQLPLLKLPPLKKVLKIASLIFLPLFIYSGHFLIFHPFSILNFKLHPKYQYQINQRFSKLPSAPLRLTAGDHHRLRSMQQEEINNLSSGELPNPFQDTVNHITYRAFLVPTEVSSHWYNYFPKIYGGLLGGYGLTPKTRNNKDFKHPANQVGIWAYKSRFPNYYKETISAYCSIDADAYSRWGYLGVIVIGFIFLGLRLLLKFLRLQGRFGNSINLCALLLLASSAPRSSLFAGVIATGFWAFLIILMLIKVYTLGTDKKHTF